ncbi:dysbindin protein homolog [Plodia interpunctella]|uniref:dysbindin protein homolog n=1 Tax=Plodia interpunctella TaxID=58824 RepID=UPI002368D58A|nr:dysbindin protein homolog [Plodia interpunctella]
MLGNIKEFISVVQDGLSNNNNLRQTLQEVQRVKNIFKEKHQHSSEAKVNYGAGGALLEKYQNDWAELHANAETNSKAAEDVDKTIQELHAIAKIRLQSAQELSHNLAQIPNLAASVAQCMESLRNVQTMMRNVEEELVQFEDIVERSAMESWKLDHHYQLSLYKEKKMEALEEIRSQLAKDNSVKSCEQERQHLAELQAKRETSAAAFNSDMARYLSSGTVPAVPKTQPNITLEQIQLDDDRTDLEKFLGS